MREIRVGFYSFRGGGRPVAVKFNDDAALDNFIKILAYRRWALVNAIAGNC